LLISCGSFSTDAAAPLRSDDIRRALGVDRGREELLPPSGFVADRTGPSSGVSGVMEICRGTAAGTVVVGVDVVVGAAGGGGGGGGRGGVAAAVAVVAGDDEDDEAAAAAAVAKTGDALEATVFASGVADVTAPEAAAASGVLLGTDSDADACVDGAATTAAAVAEEMGGEEDAGAAGDSRLAASADDGEASTTTAAVVVIVSLPVCSAPFVEAAAVCLEPDMRRTRNRGDTLSGVPTTAAPAPAPADVAALLLLKGVGDPAPSLLL